jgi:4-carboxymuconolactone decarboxylase
MNDSAPAQIAPKEAHAVSPRFAEYTDKLVYGEIWDRPGLSQRDKSMLTCAVLIALNRSAFLPFHARRAFDNGLTPRELSEIVTQLAVYCGWPMASAAVYELAPVYAERGVKPEDVAPLEVSPLAADPGMEERRKAVLESSIGVVSPPLAKYSNELLFGDLWLHPELAPRDRSMITLAAIWAMGLEPLLDYQFARALDNGVTREDISDALVHCAFYIGWPRAMAAAMVARKVLVGDEAAKSV